MVLVRSRIIACMCSLAHCISWFMMGNSEFARSVRLYSTRGGTSAYTLRSTNPSVSRVRSVRTSIFCEMSGNSATRSLKRMDSCPFRVYRTRRVHLSPIRLRIFRMGQSGYSSFLLKCRSIYNKENQQYTTKVRNYRMVCKNIISAVLINVKRFVCVVTAMLETQYY